MKKGKQKEEGRKKKEKKPPGKPGPEPSSFSLSPFTFDEVVEIALATEPKRNSQEIQDDREPKKTEK